MDCDVFSDGAESGDLSAWTGNSGAAVTAVNPHSGTYAIDLSSETDYIYKDVGSRTEVYIGFWWRPAAGWTGTQGSCITVRHSTTNQSFLFLYASDNSVMHYTGVTWKAGSAPNVITGSWQHFEWMLTIADVGGRSIVTVDGNVVLDFTGDTRGTAVYSDLDRVHFGRIGSFSNSDSFCYIDDICIGSEFTTLAPTTVAPSTVAPSTPIPTTVSLTTIVPTTILSSTIVPTTVLPSTIAPTTPVPTTPAPSSIPVPWILDNKNSGPWKFSLQPDKWGYLNNKRWTSKQDAINFSTERGLPIDPDVHFPCGHWHKTSTGYTTRTIEYPVGEWKAALEHPGEPYIYLYDKDYRAVIKINTALDPPAVVDRLVLTTDPTIQLDYDITGGGLPGAQKGGYCISNDGTRLWYMLGNPKSLVDPSRDYTLFEVDISSPDTSQMSLVKSTSYADIIPGTDVAKTGMVYNYIVSAICTSEHVLFSTNMIGGRIIKILMSDHSLVDNHTFSYPSGGYISDLERYIIQLAYNVNNDKLYWMYEDRTSFVEYRAHLLRYDTDFNKELEVIQTGTGFSLPVGNSLLRVSLDDEVFRVRTYHPITGYLIRYDEDINVTGSDSGMEWTINMLGFNGNISYFLTHLNAVQPTSYLRRYNSSFVQDAIKEVSFYTGHYSAINAAALEISWGYSGTAIYNRTSERLVTFTYREITPANKDYANKPDDTNWCATFDRDLNLLFYNSMGSSYVQVLYDSLPYTVEEPQIWTI